MTYREANALYNNRLRRLMDNLPIASNSAFSTAIDYACRNGAGAVGVTCDGADVKIDDVSSAMACDAGDDGG